MYIHRLTFVLMLQMASCQASAVESRRTLAQTQLTIFQLAAGQYKMSTGLFPTTEQGLQALRVKPAAVNNWDGPYLRKDIPNDPWGHAYVYKYPGEHGDEPDIMSYGPDGQPSADDILSWK